MPIFDLNFQQKSFHLKALVMSSSSPGEGQEETSSSIEYYSEDESTTSSSCSELDDFDRFANFRGAGKVKTSQHIMCLHYFSNALGLQFGTQNEEVYRLDQIKEWAAADSKWFEEPPELRFGKKKVC